MKFIQGQSRTRINLFPVSLDQTLDADNEVRIIDLFVDSLSIKDYGFRTDYIAYGRPAYGTIKRFRILGRGLAIFSPGKESAGPAQMSGLCLSHITSGEL